MAWSKSEFPNPVTLGPSRQPSRFVHDPSSIAHGAPREELICLGEIQAVVRSVLQHSLQRKFDLLLRRVGLSRIPMNAS